MRYDRINKNFENIGENVEEFDKFMRENLKDEKYIDQNININNYSEEVGEKTKFIRLLWELNHFLDRSQNKLVEKILLKDNSDFHEYEPNIAIQKLFYP